MNSCVICGKEGHGHRHFGAQACRACSAFFRRSIAEYKSYKCGKENKCNVTKGKYYTPRKVYRVFPVKEKIIIMGDCRSLHSSG